ncbi:MAG: DUF938 domain-containing protein [Thiohalocapsa sp.]|jgi:SAM-dependent methyltransferase
MNTIEKPFAAACEENKGPILAVLEGLFRNVTSVLEIGSGTGQHAVHFAAALPHLTWQCSDVAAYLPGIRAWLTDAASTNLPEPLLLDVDGVWPSGTYDAAFSANTAHIMSLPQIERLFSGVGRLLPPRGPFALYGPFSDGGHHNSPSNEAFDRMLRRRDPRSGVRDLDDLRRFAAEADLVLEEDVTMPVNNRILIWRRI